MLTMDAVDPYDGFRVTLTQPLAEVTMDFSEELHRMETPLPLFSYP